MGLVCLLVAAEASTGPFGLGVQVWRVHLRGSAIPNAALDC